MPTKKLKKVAYRNCLGYAILDLLAESSMWAMYLQDDLDMMELQERYPSMYENMDIDEVAGSIVVAIRQRDSKNPLS